MPTPCSSVAIQSVAHTHSSNTSKETNPSEFCILFSQWAKASPSIFSGSFPFPFLHFLFGTEVGGSGCFRTGSPFSLSLDRISE